MVIVDSARRVVGGVDTLRDSNVAAVVDMNGGLLGVESFPTTAGGHRSLSSWIVGFGTIDRVGIEGTGAFGAGLARHDDCFEVDDVLVHGAFTDEQPNDVFAPEVEVGDDASPRDRSLADTGREPSP